MSNQTKESIRIVSEKLDNLIEKKDFEEIVKLFSLDCEIELLDVTLKGREGVRTWLTWMFDKIEEISFEPVIIIIERNVFFEEFIIHAILKDGSKAASKQSEVLKSLRIYFDRLDFANAVAKGFLSKKIIKLLINKSVKGLS